MSNKRFRQVVRYLHIIEGVMIFLYVYSATLATNPIYSSAIKFVVIPAVSISGILLWQQARVLKFVRNLSNA